LDAGVAALDLTDEDDEDACSEAATAALAAGKEDELADADAAADASRAVKRAGDLED
jgi:hypothetical protein